MVSCKTSTAKEIAVVERRINMKDEARGGRNENEICSRVENLSNQ